MFMSSVREISQVSAKELMKRPQFVCSASYVKSDIYEPENGAVQYRVWFDYVGGQVALQFPDSTQLNSVGLQVGDLVRLFGQVDYNAFDGSVRLVPERYNPSPDGEVLSVRIVGYGEVVIKDVSKFNKESYYKAALRFSGGLHLFTKLTPQVYSQIPPKGSQVKFQCGLQPSISRTRDGSMVQKLGLELQAMEVVQFVNSLPSGAASASDTVKKAS
jgi:hypothetical protein